jgi:DsbC/DsbD-like thiol-disulfide interchange protein/cytochrome c biogenesis protein CcdA
MLWRLLLLLAFSSPAIAEARQNAIQPELVVNARAVPGGTADLAILMHTRPGWHGYWLNPGDAGLPMSVEWRLPTGWSVEQLRYPVPSRLLVSGIVNYVYEHDYAVLTRLRVPAGATGSHEIAATMRWLACTEEICVPEQGKVTLSVPTGGAAATDPRFDEWRRALPQPLANRARFEIAGNLLRVGIPLPRDVAVAEPYVFPATDGPVDYAGEQRFRRDGDLLIAELPRRSGDPRQLAGVLALGEGRGLSFDAVPGDVPDGGRLLSNEGGQAILWAVLGAILGGLLLNLMPCVFPILALKALHLAKSGGEERTARRDALAYTAGAIVGTGALGGALLAIRAAGVEAGWAFQLQDPRMILLLTLLSIAITLNLLRVFELPVIGGERNPAGSFGTGALAAFVATPCAGPFLGAALGTALLLPPAGSVAVFAALGLGLAMPFLLIAFVPALRRRLPRPGPWMARLQRFLAIPMAATATAGLWLMYRQGGQQALLFGLLAVAVLTALLFVTGRNQSSGRRRSWLNPALVAPVLVVAAAAMVPTRPVRDARAESEAWSEARVAAELAAGRPVFVNFTADWCLSCKANEAVAIDRQEVKAAFKAARVTTLTGDWTNGDPVITRFLESRGRAGVPLYLWYVPGKPPEELPQVLAPGMLISRAQAARR